jgi:hypothetical protein
MVGGLHTKQMINSRDGWCINSGLEGFSGGGENEFGEFSLEFSCFIGTIIFRTFNDSIIGKLCLDRFEESWVVLGGVSLISNGFKSVESIEIEFLAWLGDGVWIASSEGIDFLFEKCTSFSASQIISIEGVLGFILKFLAALLVEGFVVEVSSP